MKMLSVFYTIITNLIDSKMITEGMITEQEKLQTRHLGVPVLKVRKVTY